MSHADIHRMDTLWVSSNPALLSPSLDAMSFPGPGHNSNRITASAASTGTFIQFAPLAGPLDFHVFGEVRFWIRANRAADGSQNRPFLLEFSYRDSGDAGGIRHRWLVPINNSGRWEQRRIGIENDRRTAITDFRITSLTDLPFECFVAEMIAVNQQMLIDAETSFTGELDSNVQLTALTALPLVIAANVGDPSAVVPHTPGFNVGNEIIIRNAAGDEERRSVEMVTHAPGSIPPTTTLDFSSEPLTHVFAVAGSSVSLAVPIRIVPPNSPAPTVSPVVTVSCLDAREDLERTGYHTQRDSFRMLGTQTVCSTRRGPRAYVLDYQITVRAPEREQQLLLHELLLNRLTIMRGLRINGEVAPVKILPPPVLGEEQLGLLLPLSETASPTYVRIGTYMETAPRVETTWVRSATLSAGHRDPPHDQERITLTP